MGSFCCGGESSDGEKKPLIDDDTPNIQSGESVIGPGTDYHSNVSSSIHGADNFSPVTPPGGVSRHEHLSSLSDQRTHEVTTPIAAKRRSLLAKQQLLEQIVNEAMRDFIDIEILEEFEMGETIESTHEERMQYYLDLGVDLKSILPQNAQELLFGPSSHLSYPTEHIIKSSCPVVGGIDHDVENNNDGEDNIEYSNKNSNDNDTTSSNSNVDGSDNENNDFGDYKVLVYPSLEAAVKGEWNVGCKVIQVEWEGLSVGLTKLVNGIIGVTLNRTDKGEVIGVFGSSLREVEKEEHSNGKMEGTDREVNSETEQDMRKRKI